MRIRWYGSPRLLVFVALLFTLALVVSCGSAAPSEPGDVDQPASSASQATVAPSVDQAPTGGSSGNQDAVLPTATPAPADKPVMAESSVVRFVESQGEITQETNRHCSGSRPISTNFRPYVELLLDARPEDAELEPWLAESWESSPDAKSWSTARRIAQR